MKGTFADNKIPGISYAFTDDGIELPVLDITHPLFISTIKDDVLKTLRLRAAQKAKQVKNYSSFKRKAMTRFLKPKNTYASGMHTLALKLGPNLLKGRKGGFWHKLGSIASKRFFIAITIRMRLRDVSKYQAEILKPQLKKNPSKGLCFINIAGGPASDSINALILLHKKNPLLLEGRKIEINILDVDTYGPNFAEKSIDA